MACAIVSGITTNILYRVGDPTNTIYSSGQINYLIFANLNNLNGYMGTCFSGDINSCIYPDISGSVYQGILELLVAKNAIQNSLMSAANTYTLTEFKEGDSTVKMADRSRVLIDLNSQLAKELEFAIQQAKFTLASAAVATVIGVDGAISPENGYRINYNFYPNQS